MQLAIRFRLQSNYSELFGCNRAIFVLCWCCEWSNNWQDCQAVTNAIVNAPELPERQQNKIFLMQVDKNELQLATYNNLWACFICMFMKDKVFLETRMNNLNTIKLDFATTLCSYFLQWILCSLYLYVCADVCLMIHVLWFLIGALFTMFHYKSLMNSYLIFAIFNETLLMRPASFLTLVSNYLNRQTILSLYNAYFRSHFSSRVVSLWSLPSRDHTLDPNRMVLS